MRVNSCRLWQNAVAGGNIGRIALRIPGCKSHRTCHQHKCRRIVRTASTLAVKEEILNTWIGCHIVQVIGIVILNEIILQSRCLFPVICQSCGYLLSKLTHSVGYKQVIFPVDRLIAHCVIIYLQNASAVSARSSRFCISTV